MSRRWRVEFVPGAHRTLRKLDRPMAVRLVKDLDVLAQVDDPSARCKPLRGPLTGLWRRRVGDYRIILDIRRDELIIVAVEIGHRSSVYE